MRRQILASIGLTAFLIAARPFAPARAAQLAAQPAPTDPSPTEMSLGMDAKILCSGVFVQGRDPDLHIREDLAPFAHFDWRDDYTYAIDQDRGRVILSAPGARARVAAYSGDQGCSILPWGATEVFFAPEEVGRTWDDPAALPWPTGDLLTDEPLPPEIDGAAIEAALDWAFDDEGRRLPQNTRAVVVVHRGRIIGERYAPGWGPNTPQLSWSQGKSITAALIGVLVQQGELALDQPAPIPEWSGARDSRRRITVADLLHMSSGLDFNNWGIDAPYARSVENSHFRIYFDAIDVFAHAVGRALEHPPNTVWRYRNSDPLTLGYLVKLAAERRGESYLAFPWRHLFDRIGMRNVVLETDAWGNFIMTGYDYVSARDWARFGLLHLNDGVWEGERILPEGWSELVSTPAPASPNQGYGGLFWLNRSGEYDNAPEDAYWAAGFMGQTTMIIPSREMVIVRLGPSAGGFNGYMDELVGRVLGAVAYPLTPELVRPEPGAVTPRHQRSAR